MQEAATVKDISRSQEVDCLANEDQTALSFVGQERLGKQPEIGDEIIHPNDRPRDLLFRRILIPTDFSLASARAVESAVAIASQCDAELTILHVIDVNAQPARGESGIAGDLMQRRWDRGSEQMGELALSLRGQVHSQTVLEEGLPWETIAERSRDFDLVILGKAADRSRRRLFSQHTAQRVVENAACPVMVVPNGQGRS